MPWLKKTASAGSSDVERKVTTGIGFGTGRVRSLSESDPLPLTRSGAPLVSGSGFGGGDGSTPKPVLGEKSGEGSGEDMPTQDFDVWLFRRDAAKMAKVRRLCRCRSCIYIYIWIVRVTCVSLYASLR